MERSRRFGAREVSEGPFKGSLHVATQAYTRFHGELSYLREYLNHRVLGVQPEEVTIRDVLTNLENALEAVMNESIFVTVHKHPSRRAERFLRKITDAFVTFRSKTDWLRQNAILSTAEVAICERIRKLRNDLVHAKPSKSRRKLKYLDKPLLTRSAVQALFTDAQAVYSLLQKTSGKLMRWQLIPPGYVQEVWS